MTISPSAFAAVLPRCRAVVSALWKETSSGEERAGLLADLLRELIPNARMTGCLLAGRCDGYLALRARDGETKPGELDLLRPRISLLLSAMSSGGSPSDTLLPGLRVRSAAIRVEETSRGFLFVGLAGDTATEEVEQAAALLDLAGPAVGLCWTLESARAERVELEQFALLGQAFAGLAHDLNNALNSMMLQTSVVQLRVDEPARQELAAIRQHGAQAAGIVRSLQHVVQERREQSYAVDLNGLVAEALEENPELSGRVLLKLSREELKVQATRSALKQLVRLVLEGVGAGTREAMRVETTKSAGGVSLAVTIPERSADGEPPTVEELLWSNLDDLGRQAGQSLLRQLGGTLEVKQGSEGDVVLRIIWGQS